MKRFVPVLLASSAFVLAACGGGGTPPSSGGSGGPTPTPTQSPSTTNASGVVVDDANGAPLAGVKVALMPWAPCGPTPSPATAITPSNDGCPTPLPSPQATTDANGNFALNGVANGHYLLVIGNDVTYTPPPGYAPPTCATNCGTPSPAPFTVQAVVHDNVTLTGGNQTLKAPTLPSNAYYAAPTWETNGDYRLAKLDAGTEMPCYIAWEYLRTLNGLAASSVDEWITENIRSVVYAFQQNPATYKLITSDGSQSEGGTDCDSGNLEVALLPSKTSTNHATDPRAIWFGGQWLLYKASGANFYQGLGLTAFPIDPRSNAYSDQITWL